MSARPLILALTESGAEIARRLAGALDGAEVVEVRRAGAAGIPVGETLRAAFSEGRPVIGICAAGILVRALAPVLRDKASEPPVVAVAEDGSVAVPLLGAHHGATRLAGAIGRVLGASVALTGASDLRFGVALDDPPAGWVLANPADHKAFAAALLDGEHVRIDPALDWLTGADLPVSPDGALALRATDAPAAGSERELVYHPRALCLGVGCERDTPPEALASLVESTLASHGLSPRAISAVFSIDVKIDEPAVHALASRLGVPARFLDAARLERERPRLINPSEVVFREVGCHGVAEGAALAAGGADATLVVPKTIGARATCAVARAPDPVDPERVGTGLGHVAVVGLGPGDPALRTPEARVALAGATDSVGYAGYLDLVAPGAGPGRRHPYALGEERERVVAALDLAAGGARVALVCSGDPGIYAMATLVMECLDREARAAWRPIPVRVVPGISALQGAAARTGAPLGHDFCAISLSDLLTPWPVIERRLEAAADGDFVVALYNPVSRRRTHQLGRALEILGRARPEATPVVVARNLGRDGERVRVTTLGAHDLDDVDMLTVVLVGASSTRPVAGRPGLVYTPRGYEVEAGKRSETA